MNAQEFETLLSDLEVRVDRLRALYENWFRGYEKIEPQVARKEVERRVYALRKELPRNTALRFRYHQLFQRYTTLANYWQRTARQIEEGTYRLQVQRMRRRAEQGDGRLRRRDDESPGPRTYELEFDESLSVDDLLSDLEMDEVARAVDMPGSHHEVEPRSIAPRAPKWLSRPPARRRAISESPFTSSDLPTNPPPAHSTEMLKVPKAPALPQASGIQAVPGQQGGRAAGEGAPLRPPAAPHAPLASGTLSLPEAPSAAAQAAGGPQTGTFGAPPTGPKPAPTTPTGTLAGLPRPAPTVGQVPPAAAAQPAAGLGAPPIPGTSSGLARPRPGAPSGAADTGTSAGLPRPTPSTGVSAGLSPPTGTRPGLPNQGPTTGLKPGLPPAAPSGPAAGPKLGPAAGPKPAAPSAAAAGAGGRSAEPTTGLKPGLSPAGRPAPGAGQARPEPTTGLKPGLSPARSPGGSAGRPPTGAGGPRPEPTTGTHPGFAADIPTRERAFAPAQSGATQVGRPPPPPNVPAAPSEQRLRRIYEEYVAARRRNNEGDVRYDTLVSSIQKMLPELQKKHRGKQIDFEVVVKDGRVGLKPKAL